MHFAIPENGVLMAGVIAANLLVALYLYDQVRLPGVQSAFEWLQDYTPRDFIERHGRPLFVIGVLILAGVALVLLIPALPLDAIDWSALLDPNDPDSVRNRYGFILDDVFVAGGILALLAGVPILNRVFVQINTTIDRWRHTRFRLIKIHNLELLTADQFAGLLKLVAQYLRWALLLLIGSVCLTLLFSLYPVTRGLALSVQTAALDTLESLWAGVLDFIPHLVTILIIAFIARLSLKGLRFFYEGLERGRIRYDGIHAELVEPTYQLARFFIVAFALVAAFPYIPGSDSPVFRGLSIFIGFLLSLGSTSLVSNIVSGIVLTYTRGLRIGDRVEVAGSVGDVIDRTLLVTRLRTIKNVIISIPNSIVLQNKIVNYSTDADERGLILHTSITIGYDVPWRQVEALMLAAARHTPDVLSDPPPFVLKTSLDDYYVSYEINAFTDKPARMAVTYSNLHKNILDSFHQAGVEIMSPAFMAVRDGNSAAIPAEEGEGG